MSPEQLDEIEKLAEARLRVGDALADRLLLTISALREAQMDHMMQPLAWLNEHRRYNEAMDEVEKLKAEVERLRRLLGEIP